MKATERRVSLNVDRVCLVLLRRFILQTMSARDHVFRNIVQALIEKFGATVQPDVDELNDSYLIYVGNVTIEVTFNEDSNA
jgi:hypothetical protein